MKETSGPTSHLPIASSTDSGFCSSTFRNRKPNNICYWIASIVIKISTWKYGMVRIAPGSFPLDKPGHWGTGLGKSNRLKIPESVLVLPSTSHGMLKHLFHLSGLSFLFWKARLHRHVRKKGPWLAQISAEMKESNRNQRVMLFSLKIERKRVSSVCACKCVCLCTSM